MSANNRHFNKAFGIGLSRTGTMSLDAIYKNCGLKSRHFLGFSVDETLWTSIDEIDAACDTPIPSIFQELDQRYPNSKFILTVRDLEPWLQSMRWMFSEGAILWRYGLATDAYHNSFFGTHRYDEAILADHWHRYHDQVESYFSGTNRLLKIRTEDLKTSRIAEFLEIDNFVDENPRRNQRKKPSLKQTLRYRVDRFLGNIE